VGDWADVGLAATVGKKVGVAKFGEGVELGIRSAYSAVADALRFCSACSVSARLPGVI
jgi:hypothetical protein